MTLAETMEESKEGILNGIDETYRAHTRHAMRNNPPGEIHVRFTKKKDTESRDIAIDEKHDDKSTKGGGAEISVNWQEPR